MIEHLAAHAPVAGLLFFFTVFITVAFWALKPSNKARFKAYADIPLKEEHHGGQ